MHTPRQFSDYPNTRIITDCFELFIERSSLLKANCETKIFALDFLFHSFFVSPPPPPLSLSLSLLECH